MSADPYCDNDDTFEDSTVSKLMDGNEHFSSVADSNIYYREILEFEIMWNGLQTESEEQEIFENLENVFRDFSLSN